MKFVKNGDSPDEYFLVVDADKDALTAAPAYMTAEEKRAATGAASTTDTTTTASTATDSRNMLMRPDVTREGYKSIHANELTADKLEGARVYGPKDEDVGEINKIILSEDGKKIDKLVLDIGGFLGMGEHQIAVSMDELNIVRNADGSDFRVYIDSNKPT